MGQHPRRAARELQQTGPLQRHLAAEATTRFSSKISRKVVNVEETTHDEEDEGMQLSSGFPQHGDMNSEMAGVVLLNAAQPCVTMTLNRYHHAHLLYSVPNKSTLLPGLD